MILVETSATELTQLKTPARGFFLCCSLRVCEPSPGRASRGTEGAVEPRFAFVYSHAAGWGVFREPTGTRGGSAADVDIQDLFITHASGREKMRD